ncbi:MAG: glycosyltransferase family 2 protein [Bacteroidales bacterium]|nr:glycosyltransferase family 2 protein [Bacteroidales bacterium]
MPKVSIISPVYQAAPFIEACLDSILKQSFQDFEVLLVDDHGPDNSMELARSFVAQRGEEHRFRFLETPQNSGPGIARNIGIEAAQGDFVVFVDSDDLLKPEYLQQLLASAVSAEGSYRDLAYCQLAYSNGKEYRNPVLEAGMFTSRKKSFFLKHFVTFAVCFMYRREFLLENNLFFPNERNSEDTNFLTRCLLLAQSIACVDKPLYVYCVRDNSLTTGRNRNKWKQRLSAANKLMEAFRSMKFNPRYKDLHLEHYNAVMYYIYFKKGLAQALLDLVR